MFSDIKSLITSRRVVFRHQTERTAGAAEGEPQNNCRGAAGETYVVSVRKAVLSCSRMSRDVDAETFYVSMISISRTFSLSHTHTLFLSLSHTHTLSILSLLSSLSFSLSPDHIIITPTLLKGLLLLSPPPDGKFAHCEDDGSPSRVEAAGPLRRARPEVLRRRQRTVWPLWLLRRVIKYALSPYFVMSIPLFPGSWPLLSNTIFPSTAKFAKYKQKFASIQRHLLQLSLFIYLFIY
jgi:hypothetical protein